jgi:S1-C subfamily serine protease
MKRILWLLFVGSCAFGGGLLSVAIAPKLVSMVAAQTGSSAVLRGGDALPIADRFEAVARRVSPAVVSVEASKPAGPSNGTSKGRGAVEESGSGVVIRAANRPGYFVLTNNHVIAQARAEQISIGLADGRVLRPAQIWADPESDIAVLRLDGVDDLPVAALGNSDQMRVGQWVLAIGSPFGLNQTVTHGIISARERGQVSLGSTIRIKDFLQTDAAINPGSSGGPLVNLDGEVIGLNTAIASQNGGSSGVAFSIPINLVKRVMQQLLEKGSVSRGYLGVQLAGSFEAADALRLGLHKAQGARVEAIYPDTPAAAAGLRANDVLLQVDGQAIRNENQLINYISDLSPGQKVRLQVWRERKMVAVDATVGDWSQAQSRFRAAR